MSNTCSTCQHFRVTHDGPHCFKGRIKPVSPIASGDCWEPVTEKAEIATKVCSRCGRELPVEKFGRHSKTKDGYQPICRECRASDVKGRPQLHAKRKAKPAPAPVPEAETKTTGLLTETDEAIIAELRRRGWSGTITKTITYNETL